MSRAAVSVGLIALLSACSMAPHYQRPASPIPPSWPTGDPYLKQTDSALPHIAYQDIFRDRRLQQVIALALTNNRDLRIAAANIVSARAQYHIQRAELLPEIDASARASFTNGRAGTGQNTSGTGTTANTSGTNRSYSADVGISAFELDLFGRVRSLSNAALNQYLATEAGARATRLTLVADVAGAWLTYAADKSLLAVAQSTAQNATRSVELTRARLEGGIAPRIDLRQAQLIEEAARSDLAQQRTALAQDVNALQLLVGAPVDTTLLPGSIEEVEKGLAELPAGLDSAILLRRPDVVQAEYQLKAANAQIGAARADLFPRISLTTLAGFASSALADLFTGGSFNWSVAPSAQYPIFRAGAGIAGVRQSSAERDAALATYERTIQTAFREVADALARRGTIGEQLRADSASVAAADDNYRLSDALYRGGIDTFLQSLDAQRSLYSAQRSLVTTRLTHASNLVTLYRVLGGDSLAEPALSANPPSDGGSSERVKSSSHHRSATDRAPMAR